MIRVRLLAPTTPGKARVLSTRVWDAVPRVGDEVLHLGVVYRVRRVRWLTLRPTGADILLERKP